MEFILLINFKMQPFIGIFTFISRIFTSSESFEAREILFFQHVSFYEQLNFMFS